MLTKRLPALEHLLQKRAPIVIKLILNIDILPLKVHRFERVHVVIERLIVIEEEPNQGDNGQSLRTNAADDLQNSRVPPVNRAGYRTLHKCDLEVASCLLTFDQ